MEESRAETHGRSTVATIAVAVALVSALAVAILLLGVAFDIEGAEEGEDASGWRVIFSVAWVSWLIGSVAALIAGAIAYFSGRRRGEPATRRAGGIALGWFVISLAIFIFVAVSS